MYNILMVKTWSHIFMRNVFWASCGCAENKMSKEVKWENLILIFFSIFRVVAVKSDEFFKKIIKIFNLMWLEDF